MTTKRQQAADYFRAGNFKNAFRIYRTFKDKYSEQELRAVEIAYESLTGKSAFYLSLGIDTAEMHKQAVTIISNKFFNK